MSKKFVLPREVIDAHLGTIRSLAEEIKSLPVVTSAQSEQRDRAVAALREAKVALESYRYLSGPYQHLAD